MSLLQLHEATVDQSMFELMFQTSPHVSAHPWFQLFQLMVQLMFQLMLTWYLASSPHQPAHALASCNSDLLVIVEPMN